jgi:hypothetical protein
MAIDRAVREMLDVEPPMGLRGRVLDRIQQPRRSFAWVWTAVPIAAAAVILLAVVVSWRQAALPARPAVPVVAEVEPRVTIPVVGSSKTPETPMVASIPLAFVTPRARRPAPSGLDDSPIAAALAPADDASEIDPLSPIAPITVPSVSPVSITPAEIAISPLSPIVELRIAPLSPPERRN